MIMLIGIWLRIENHAQTNFYLGLLYLLNQYSVMFRLKVFAIECCNKRCFILYYNYYKSIPILL